MPPKKNTTKKATSKKGDSKKSTGSGKKGAKGKKKKVVHEGPIEWKLTKDRLEELKALSIVSSKIKSQIMTDMEHLTKAFAPREPFKHWTLKSPEIPLLGIASSEARGVLCQNEPLYPMIDTADRRAISRCWRAIRLHFEPIGSPNDKDDDDDDDHRNNNTHNHHHEDGGGDMSFLGSPMGSRSGSRGDSRGGGSMSSMSQIEGWVGPMTLYGMSRWLNNRGEKFPGSGFPYDEVVWKPLEVIILKHFKKTKDGFLKAKWKQPPFNPLSSLDQNGGGAQGGGGGFLTTQQDGSLPSINQQQSNGHASTISAMTRLGQTNHNDDDEEDDEDDEDENGHRKTKKPQVPKWSSRTALISSLTNDGELVKLKHEVELPPSLTTTPPATGRSEGTAGGGGGGGKNSSTDKSGAGSKKKGKKNGGTTTPPVTATSVTLTADEINEQKEELEAKLLALGPELGRVITRINDSDDLSHVNLSDAAGNFAIAVAAERGSTQAVYMLCKAGCYVDAPGQGGNTALHYASSAGFLDVVKVLIAAGADVGTQNAHGESALHLASRYGHADVVKVLVAGGAPVSSWTVAHHSPIHFAAGAGHLPCLKLLDKAAASEGKSKGKKGAAKGKTSKKDASNTTTGPAPSTAPPMLGIPIEKATLNSLSHSMEPPILRTVKALGGRGACQDGEVLKDPNQAALSATLQYLGGKFKDPLAVKAGGKKDKAAAGKTTAVKKKR